MSPRSSPKKEESPTEDVKSTCFSTELKTIVTREPTDTQAKWADRFGIYRPYLSMLLAGGGSLGHKTIARLIAPLSRADREKLIGAYFMDEAVSIHAELAELTRAPQELVPAKQKAIKAAVETVTASKDPIGPLDTLPVELREKLIRFLKHAESEPRLLKKLEAIIELVEG